MPTQNIIIEFTADTTGLQPAIEGITKLANLDGAAASAFDKTNTSLNQRKGLIENNNTALAKFVQTITNSNKAVVGDVYGKVLENIRNELSLTNEEASAFYKNIIAISEQSLITAKTTEEIQTFNDLIKIANTALDTLGDGVSLPTTQLDQFKTKEQEVIDKTKLTEIELQKLKNISIPVNTGTTTPIIQSPIAPDFEPKVLRGITLLRQMKEEIRVLETEGISFSTKFGLSFDELTSKASKLENQIGDTNQRIQQMSSDTFAIDAVAGAMGGLVAGANAASGAFILFGGEQDEVQQAILKTMGLMQLLNGIQQVSNLFVDQSVAKTGLQVLSKKLFTTTIKEQTGAIVEQAGAQKTANVATDQGTVSQTALNTAMLLSPIGVLVAGLALLTAGIAVFAIAVNKTSEAEEREVIAAEASNEAHLKAGEAYAKEEANLNVLLATAKDNALTREEQQAALDKAIKQYPEYLHSLTLDNLLTSQSSEAIAKQINLIKQRAFAQAAQDVYAEKLKKVAEAEANLNRIREQGADLGDRIAGFFTEEADHALKTGADVLALERAQRLLNEANNEASGAFSVVTTGIENVSKAMRAGSQDAINLVTNLNQLTQAALGLPTDIKIGINQEAVKPFDPDQFDKEKAAALATAQYRIEVAKKGSAEEFAARRAYVELERSLALRDVRLTHDERLQQEGETLSKLHDLNQQARERFFKDQIASAKALTIELTAEGKESTNAFFEARKSEIIKTAQEARAQEGITAGEIKQINAQLNLDLENLELERRDKALEIQKTLTQDRLNLAEKGSADELNAQVAILEIEKNIELNNAKNNAAKIAEINDRFRQLELDKILAFNQKVKQDSDNSAIANTQHLINQLQLQGVSDTNDQIIDLKKKLIEEEAQLEIDSIPVSGITEEKRHDLIQSIYDKELLAKKALEDAKNRVEVDSVLKSQQGLLGIQKTGLDILANIAAAFGPARAKLNQQLFQNDLDNIKAERIANNQLFLDKLETQEEFTKKSKQLDDDETNAKIANAERAAKARTAAFAFYADTVQKGVDFLFDGEKQKLEQSLQDNQALLSAKLISQDEFNKRQKKIKQEEAAVDKQKAIFDVLIDFAKQLFAIEAQAAALAVIPIIGPALAAAALAQIPFLVASEVIALGLISAAKFKQGKVKIEGPGTQTSDSIPARISKDESVINAKATTSTTSVAINDKKVTINHEDLLNAVNEHRLDKYLTSVLDVKAFSNKDVTTLNIHEKQINIEHKKLTDILNETRSLYSLFERKNLLKNESNALINNISEYRINKYLNETFSDKNTNSNQADIDSQVKVINDLYEKVISSVNDHEVSNIKTDIRSLVDNKETSNISEAFTTALNTHNLHSYFDNVFETVATKTTDRESKLFETLYNLTKGTTVISIDEKKITLRNEDMVNAMNEHRIDEYLHNEIFNSNNPNKSNNGYSYINSFFNNDASSHNFNSLSNKVELARFSLPEFTKIINNIPVMRDLPQWVEKYISKESHEVHRETISNGIDYDKMGDKIGKRVGKEINTRPIEFGFDEDGLYAHYKAKQKQEEYAEKRRGYNK